MQQAECTTSELCDFTESVASGVGTVDLISFKAALDSKFALLQGVLQKKVCFLRIYQSIHAKATCGGANESECMTAGMQ